MATPIIPRAALAIVLCSALPDVALAQRVDALRSAVGSTSHSLSLAATSSERARDGAVRDIESGTRPDLRRHAIYGAVGGAALWTVYFALPTEADAARSERALVLPAAALTGATVGFVVGLVRRAF